MVSTFPSYNPDLSSSRKREPKILKAEFGDGYSQVTGDGIHPFKETWSMSFTNRPNADIDAIVTFLDGLNGASSFYWTPPGETPLTPVKRWIQTGAYEYTRTGPGSATLTFNLERVFTV